MGFIEDDLNKTVHNFKEQGFDVFHKFVMYQTKSRYSNANIIKEKFGSLDILINNAGTVYTGYMLNSDEELENLINVNFTSMIYTIRAFMPAMRKKFWAYYKYFFCIINDWCSQVSSICCY